MATSRSQSPKSQPGENGPEDNKLPSNLEKSESQLPSKPQVSEYPKAAALPVKDSGRMPFKSGQVFMTAQDLKLVARMNKEISSLLGLNSKSRSRRVS